MNSLKSIISKLANSLKFSIDGIIAVWSSEQSFRMESYVAIFAILIAMIMPFSMIEKLLLILLMLLLLVSELINSAIEAIVDRISPEIHPLSKIAKDASSAAVAIVILMNVIAWIFAITNMILFH